MTLMTYEKFCDKMQESLTKHYGEEVRVSLQKVDKNNGITLMGITIYEKGASVLPTVYLEGFYQSYIEGMDFKEVFRYFLEKYDSYRKDHVDMDFFTDYSQVKELLSCKLVHYEMNWSFLKKVPHRKYLDLAIVYQCHISNDILGEGAITIRNEHLKMWNIDEERLYQDAMNNMPKMYPPEFMNMAYVLRKMFEDEEDMLGEELPLFVLSNHNRIYGATCLLYQNQLEHIGNMLQDDFYILPSSIHEVLILPKKYGSNEDELSQMVDEINQAHVEPEEILSNHAYFYARGTELPICLPLIPKQENASY